MFKSLNKTLIKNIFFKYLLDNNENKDNERKKTS